jgi:hypothetical protein
MGPPVGARRRRPERITFFASSSSTLRIAPSIHAFHPAVVGPADELRVSGARRGQNVPANKMG